MQPVRHRLHVRTVLSENKRLISLLVVAAVGMAVSSTFLQRPNTTAITPVITPVLVSAEVAAPVVLSKSEPVGIRISQIGVDAKIIPLGLKADGSMQTPSDGETVGWYKYSPTPGEIGPSVVAAHVDTKAGPAVFAKLHTLSAGQQFEILRADGTSALFEIKDIQKYSQADFPTEKVYGNTDQSEIRLITCGGAFSTETKRYSHNTVVYAQLVTPR